MLLKPEWRLSFVKPLQNHDRPIQESENRRIIKELCLRFDPNALTHSAEIQVSTKSNSLLVRMRMEEWFRNIWDKARTAYSKLTFYNQVKVIFAKEPCIQLSNHKKAKCIAWLRSSSHRLNVETDRYGNKVKSIHHRACNFCRRY